jgi:hypothetical protein
MRYALLLSLLLGTCTFAVACGDPPAPSGTSEPEQKSGDDDDDDDDKPAKKAPAPAAPPPAATTPPPAATPPPVTPVRPVNTCQTARDLGEVNGDGGGNPITTEGTCSEWVRVRVREADDGFGGEELKVKVTLTPPTGHDFELLGFVNTVTDIPECRAPSAASEKNGDQPESFDLEWGESFVGNGADDSRTLSIHVKSVSGACAPTPWKLTIQGG